MKLRKWKGILDRLNFSENVNVALLMIVNSDNNKRLKYIIDNNGFPHPVCFDSKGEFAEINNLTNDDDCHTFLLNENREVVLVGNPIGNKKIFDLYCNVIFGEGYDANYSKIFSIGHTHPGDTIGAKLVLKNELDSFLTVQKIVPSCECVLVSLDNDTIFKGEAGLFTINFIVDSISGMFKHSAEIYFKEKENPQRISVCGYVINNHNEN